jgi:Fe-S-cluster-containing dehydrogenase component
MHNDERCIGCRSCQEACPYSMEEVTKDGTAGQYSVISYNDEGEQAHPFFANKTELIKGCTTSGAELAALTGANPPHRTNYKHSEYGNVRRDNIVEKCILCDHRLRENMLPACVDACPSGARVFGDLKDSGSGAAKLLANNKSFVLKEKEGTSPNVHYIRNYSAR